MRSCAICGKRRHARTGERVAKLPSILASLGVDGEHAHATCAVEKRARMNKRRERTK